MSRDGFNDSIIMNNMGGSSAPNIELDLEPQDVIDTEFVEQLPPKKSRKKLFLALALAGVVISGVAALQFPQVHALLEGNNQKLDLAVLSGLEGGPNTAGNPFALPEAAVPQQAVTAVQLPVDPVQTEAMPDSAPPQVAVAAAPQSALVAGEIGAEAELLAVAAGGEPVAAESIVSAPVQQVQQMQPAPQAVIEAPVVAPVQAAVSAPAPISAQPAPAPAASVPKVDKPVEPEAINPTIETKKAPPAETKKASAPVQRKTETAQRSKPSEPSSKEPETVRDVMVVTASQIGLRAFTDGQLVVSTGGRDAAYRVHDLLPSGERIERIDAVAMTVITDRSVIRVKP